MVGIENLIRQNVAIFDFRFHQVLIASKPAPRYRIRHLYFLFAGEVRPPNPQRMAGSLASQIGDLWTLSTRRMIDRICCQRPREPEVDSDGIHIRRGITPPYVRTLGLRSLEWSAYTSRKTWAKKCVKHGERKRTSRAEKPFFRQAKG